MSSNRSKPFAHPSDSCYVPPAKVFPDRLTFAEPHFLPGLNLTIRRGIKWDGLRGPVEVDDVAGNLLGTATVEFTMDGPFLAIPQYLLAFEHSAESRDLPGLLDALRVVYPDFTVAETVTLVFFRFASKAQEPVFT